MRRAAALLEGTHDFAGFQASHRTVRVHLQPRPQPSPVAAARVGLAAFTLDTLRSLPVDGVGTPVVLENSSARGFQASRGDQKGSVRTVFRCAIETRGAEEEAPEVGVRVGARAKARARVRDGVGVRVKVRI